MLWIILCLCVGVSVANDIRCDHPQCVFKKHSASNWWYFTVEGHNVKIRYRYDNMPMVKRLHIECYGSQVLDSAAMPRFPNELLTPFVMLINCSLPARDVSLLDSLSALNITLRPEDTELELVLRDLPVEPPLTAHHLRGLEQLTWFAVHASSDPQPTPAAGFLEGLPNLRSLLLSGVKIPPNELLTLPRSVDLFHSSDDSTTETLLKTLSDTSLALPSLRELTLEQRPLYDDMFDLWGFDFITRKKYYKIYQEVQRRNDSRSIEILRLLGWKGQTLPPFEHCDSLLSLELSNTNIEELPERWVAACPRLEHIKIEEASNLRQLPEKLLEGATALKKLTIEAKLAYLPENWLQGAPNLLNFVIRKNRIKNLSSNQLSGPALQSLSVKWNSLSNSALSAFSSQTALIILDLSSNDFTGDICNDEDYAALRNMTQLRTLDMSYNSIRVCPEWRQSFPHLQELTHVGTEWPKHISLDELLQGLPTNRTNE